MFYYYFFLECLKSAISLRVRPTALNQVHFLEGVLSRNNFMANNLCFLKKLTSAYLRNFECQFNTFFKMVRYFVSGQLLLLKSLNMVV